MQTNSDYSHTVAITETVIEKGEEVTYRVGSKDMSKTKWNPEHPHVQEVHQAHGQK